MNDFVYDAAGNQVFVGDTIWYATANSRGSAELTKAIVTRFNDVTISVTAYLTERNTDNVDVPRGDPGYNTSIRYDRLSRYSGHNRKILKAF